MPLKQMGDLGQVSQWVLMWCVICLAPNRVLVLQQYMW